MKKVTAIFFACLVLFNALGFYGLLVGMQYQSGRALEVRLDNEDYEESETVTLKFPMPIPYHIDKGTYNRVDGKVEHQGEFFRLVKQKLEKDTLYIVCIKDRDSKRLSEALADYVKTYTDKPVDGKQLLKGFNFTKDFLPTTTSLQSSSSGWHYDIYPMYAIAYYNSVSAMHKSPPPRG